MSRIGVYGWILLATSISLAETRVGENLFLFNNFLFANGTDGQRRVLRFDGQGNLLFGNFKVADSHPIVTQISNFYCRNLGRPLSGSLRFRFFIRMMRTRFNNLQENACLNRVAQILKDAPNSQAKRIFQQILDNSFPRISNSVTDTPTPRTLPSVEGSITKPNSPPTPSPPSEPKIHSGAPTDPTVRPTAASTKNNLFCSNPKQAICNKAKENAEGSNITLQRAQLHENLAKKAGVLKTDLENDDPRAWVQYLTEMRNEFSQEEAKRLKDTEFWNAKLTERLKRDPTLSSVAQKMENRIRSNPSPLENLIAQFLKGELSVVDFRVYCGSDGLGRGGFNENQKTPPQIAICPAAFSPLQPIEVFLRTYLHEKGHSIDGTAQNREFRLYYRAYQDCWKQVGIDARSLGSSPAEREAELTTAETVGQALLGKDSNEALEVVSRFLGNFCTGEGGEVIFPSQAVQAKFQNTFSPSGIPQHFNTDFMINVLWGRNPDLRQTICGARTSQLFPTCNRSGRAF